MTQHQRQQLWKAGQPVEPFSPVAQTPRRIYAAQPWVILAIIAFCLGVVIGMAATTFIISQNEERIAPGNRGTFSGEVSE